MPTSLSSHAPNTVGSIRTKVVQHPRVVRPAAARLLRGSRPTEADAALPPGGMPPRSPGSSRPAAAAAMRSGGSRLAECRHGWQQTSRLRLSKTHFALPQFLCFAAGALQAHAARVFCARRGSRPAHVEQPACSTRCPKEPHEQRSWHLQRSPPAQSEDLPPEVWLAESLRRRAARPTPRNRACFSTSRSSSERLGQPHFWWQILRLRWR